MLFLCPHNKQIYTSSDYKLDEGRNTPNTFDLKYDGGILIGLYNHQSPIGYTESFPEELLSPFLPNAHMILPKLVPCMVSLYLFL
jgi:hypothetical protein